MTVPVQCCGHDAIIEETGRQTFQWRTLGNLVEELIREAINEDRRQKNAARAGAWRS